jgi:uncharacterized membrane protein YheB (UPF0754 family)
MPRTPVPDHLIHRPEDVERNARRFDYLCQLAEEVALPVVTEALQRETTETAAEVLTHETTQALEALAEEAAVLQELDEKEIISDLRRSLTDAIPSPDEEECRQHARDLSQVLMSTLLESFRSAQAKLQIVELSDYLVPEASGLSWLFQKLGKSKLPNELTDTLASFAVNEADIGTILKTLRSQLFAEPRQVALPDDLTLVGAPQSVMVMKQQVFGALLEKMKEVEAQKKAVAAPAPAKAGDYEFKAAAAEASLVEASYGFATVVACNAARHLIEPLELRRYRSFAKVASLKATDLDAAKMRPRVDRAISTAE